MSNGEWAEQALCPEVDPEIFFETKSWNPKVAKRICDSCPVKAECLKYALDNEIKYGVWGGTTRPERLTLIRLERPDFKWSEDEPVTPLREIRDARIAAYTRDGFNATEIAEVMDIDRRTVVRGRERTGTSNYRKREAA